MPRLIGTFAVCAVAILLGCSDDPTQPPPDGPGFVAQPIDALPRWSPDGTRILFYHYGTVSIQNGTPIIDPQVRGLWVVGSDGNEPRQLLRGSSIYADWNAGSDTLVYEVGGQVFRAALSDSAVDSLSIEQLTSGGSNHFPAWSPDSNWIAYDSNAGGTGPFEIWIMRPDGSDKRRIDRTGMGEWRMPSWSPALSICHVRYPDDTDFAEVFTMTDQGGSPLRVTRNGSEEALPRYSPDGSKLVFHSISSGDIGVWISNADGSNARRLITGRDPCWSPDGQWLAFVRFTASPQNSGTIWKMRPDGTGLTPVTFGPFVRASDVSSLEIPRDCIVKMRPRLA